MLENLRKYQIVLGSNSPRRKELLSGLGVEFQVKAMPDIDESYPNTIKTADIPEYIARQKAVFYKQEMTDNMLLITADTIVVVAGKVLGKPDGFEGAIEMLQELSGREHEVITGVCLTTKDKIKSFSVSSTVRFSQLSKEEIVYYVEKYTPYDKAGAYGIQEWIGFVAVEAISGSFYNVMGLPVQRLYQELKHL